MHVVAGLEQLAKEQPPFVQIGGNQQNVALAGRLLNRRLSKLG